MAWLQDLSFETLQIIVCSSQSMYFVCKIDGRILWANDAFCQWSNYPLHELLNMTWMELCSSDDDLQTNEELAQGLASYRINVTVQKKYVPKNGTPQNGSLHITRYPLAGEIQFCWCRWELHSGTDTRAFELAIQASKDMTAQLKSLTSEIRTITNKTDEETWMLSTFRMAMKHPRIAFAIIVVLFALRSGADIITTLQRLGFVASPPVVVEGVKHPVQLK